MKIVKLINNWEGNLTAGGNSSNEKIKPNFNSLRGIINENKKNNSMILKTLLVLTICFFVIVSFFIIYYLNYPKIVITLIGSEGIGLYFIINKIYSLYIENRYIDLIILTISDTSINEDEKLKIIQVVKRDIKNKENRNIN